MFSYTVVAFTLRAPPTTASGPTMNAYAVTITGRTACRQGRGCGRKKSSHQSTEVHLVFQSDENVKSFCEEKFV